MTPEPPSFPAIRAGADLRLTAVKRGRRRCLCLSAHGRIPNDAGGRVFLRLSQSAPAFPGVPSCSCFVPSGRLLRGWSGKQATEARHSRRSESCGAGRGDRIGTCGLFVSNGGPQFAAVPLSTRGSVLSTTAVRLVRPVRLGGPGFVPFLFSRRPSPPSPGRWLTRATWPAAPSWTNLARLFSRLSGRWRSTKYDRTRTDQRMRPTAACRTSRDGSLRHGAPAQKVFLVGADHGAEQLWLCCPLPQTSGGPSTGRTPYRRLISRSTPGSGGP